MARRADGSPVGLGLPQHLRTTGRWDDHQPLVARAGAGPLRRVVRFGRLHALDGAESDGTVWTWGRNADGQLGDGTTASATTPVRTQGSPW